MTRDTVAFGGSIFGYDTVVSDNGAVVELRGENKPPLVLGLSLELRGDSQGYVPGGFRSGVRVEIVGFCEPWKDGETDHIVRVSDGRRAGWVKPSNLVLTPLEEAARLAAAAAPDDAIDRAATLATVPDSGPADPEHYDVLVQGAACWNRWREQHPDLVPRLARVSLQGIELREVDLCGADLAQVDAYGADLYKAKLRSANLERAHLQQANLLHADLSGANLSGANLAYADLGAAQLLAATLIGADVMNSNLSGADCRRADLTSALLTYSQLFDADLRGATLVGTDLMATLLVRVNLKGATLVGCRVHGAAVWKVETDENTIQSNIIASDVADPTVTTDSIEVAQLIHLLISTAAMGRVIDSMTGRAVLLLGRFTEERVAVLDAIAARLRELGDLPIIFNFDKPVDRSISETVLILAGLSKFIIADLTNPRSSPYEAHLAVPQLAVPFVPIIQSDEEPFAMFDDLLDHDWVMEEFAYRDVADLLENLTRLREEALAIRASIEGRRRKRARRRASSRKTQP